MSQMGQGLPMHRVLPNSRPEKPISRRAHPTLFAVNGPYIAPISYRLEVDPRVKPEIRKLCKATQLARGALVAGCRSTRAIHPLDRIADSLRERPQWAAIIQMR